MKIKKAFYGFLTVVIMMMLCSCASGEKQNSDKELSSANESILSGAGNTSENVSQTPELELIGHSSVKIKMSDGRIIYIDPAYVQEKDAYDDPADIILITHDHSDHNQVSLLTQNDNCITITHNEALQKGVYQKFELRNGLTVEAVPAENANHSIDECVGYLISFDNITVYHAGDTSSSQKIADFLNLRRIEYALYPIDGEYNMDANEATKFARLIGAKNNIPMHISDVSSEYDEAKAKTFTPGGALYIPYGDTIKLRKYRK